MINKKGQTVAEFALVAIPLILLIFVGIQFAFVLHSYLAISHLAREGARYSAVNASKTDSQIRNYILSIKQSNLKTANLNIEIIPSYTGGVIPPTRYTGNPISVGIRYNLSGHLFLPTSFFGISIPTTLPGYTVTMRIEKL